MRFLNSWLVFVVHFWCYVYHHSRESTPQATCKYHNENPIFAWIQHFTLWQQGRCVVVSGCVRTVTRYKRSSTFGNTMRCFLNELAPFVTKLSFLMNFSLLQFSFPVYIKATTWRKYLCLPYLICAYTSIFWSNSKILTKTLSCCLRFRGHTWLNYFI